MNPLRHLLGVGAVVLLVGSVVGLATRDDGGAGAPTGPGEVAIADFTFSPDPVTVAVGATLTWTNTDTADHTVDSSGGVLDSGSIKQGETFAHTFDEAGTFAYVCAFHPFMQGTVEVTG
jgi:plastocyanin